MDWLTYFGGGDRPGELFYKIFLSNDLTVTFTILLFWIDLISFNSSIWFTVGFHLFGNSYHVFVPFFIAFFQI